MLDDKYLELMHGELDGANSPKASAKLGAYLAANPEARQFYQELVSMSAMLQEVKPVAPPPHLQHAVMNALPPRRSSAQTKPNLLLEAGKWLAAKFEFKYAFAFAGGLTAGVLVFALFLPAKLQEEATDWSKLYGTIGAPHAAENMPGEKRWEIRQSEVAGTISLKNAGKTLAIEIALDSPQLIALVISFDGKASRFKSFMCFDEAVQAEMVMDRGAIRFAHTGRQNYAAAFELRAASVPVMNLQILRAGEVVYGEKILP